MLNPEPFFSGSTEVGAPGPSPLGTRERTNLDNPPFAFPRLFPHIPDPRRSFRNPEGAGAFMPLNECLILKGFSPGPLLEPLLFSRKLTRQTLLGP